MLRLSRRVFLKLILLMGTSGGQLIDVLKVFSAPQKREEWTMMLPKPYYNGNLSVGEAIKHRRTVRSFSSRPIDKGCLSQILYAAQGITEEGGFKRATPSGGALYPLDVYAVVGGNAIEDLDAGVYHYVSSGHLIELVAGGDKKEQLAMASLHQMWMAKPPLNLVITAEYSRICSKYGERGRRYAMIEAGHVGQNIFLQAEELGLNAGIVGAFEDMKIIRALGIPNEHEPLLVMPVGYRS